jgi:hypothetical protein
MTEIIHLHRSQSRKSHTLDNIVEHHHGRPEMFATCGPWLHTTHHRCPAGTLHERASHGSISRWDVRVALPSDKAMRWEEYRTSPPSWGGRSQPHSVPSAWSCAQCLCERGRARTARAMTKRWWLRHGQRLLINNAAHQFLCFA